MNPILALAGSPGSGKTAFLLNFPLGEEYRSFIASNNNTKQPIISIITFNGGMTIHPHLLGRRVLFGGCLAMGLLDSNIDSLWRTYCNEGSFKDDISVEDAVEILQAIFGKDRPVFIGVDELSKSKDYASDHVTRLGSALDDLRCLDVIVTSLSPAYIYQLVTGSNRSIVYFIPESLLDYGLGRKECMAWSQSLINEARARMKMMKPARRNCEISSMKINLLNNLYLVYSGHPRSLALMVKEMKRQVTKLDERELIIDNLIHSDRQQHDVEHLLFILLNRYRKDLKERTFSLYEPHELSQVTDYHVLDNLILRGGVICSLHDIPFRMMVETGTVLIDKKLSSNLFQPSISFYALLDFFSYIKQLDKATIITPNMSAASMLFQSLSSLKLSAMWERILLYSIMGISSHLRFPLADIFGVRNMQGNNYLNEEDNYRLNLSIPTNDTDLNYVPNINTLSLPYRADQPGYDGRIAVYLPTLKTDEHRSPLWIYVQVKLAKSNKKELNQVLADDN